MINDHQIEYVFWKEKKQAKAHWKKKITSTTSLLYRVEQQFIRLKTSYLLVITPDPILGYEASTVKPC